MTTLLLLLTALVADPAPEQTALLKAFRDEFVAIKTDGTELAPYAIAKYEVTQELWQAVVGANPSRWKGKRNSVEMLSHAEAEGFCRRATEQLRAAKLINADQAVRLPSEAEWEHAARAGTTTRYSFGDDPEKLRDFGWYTGNAAGNDPPVGAKKPNPWGLYDVHGYLWEWVSGEADGRRIVRGGSWKEPAEECTSASRRVVDPNLRDDAVGLRCVLAQVAAVPDSKTSTSAVGDFRPTAQDKILPAGRKLELLWDEGEFTEGPALAPDGSIFFSDIGNTIYRFDPKTGKTAEFRSPSGRSNGLAFNHRGELVACEGANTGGNRRISITTGIQGGKDGAVRTLADRFDGKRFNSPNDLAIDAKGNVYFTDPRYVGDDPRELDFEGVFVVAPDGVTRVATREVEKPNGIAIALDGRTVYVADNNPRGSRHLLAFAVQPDGTLSAKRVLHDFGMGRGIDGMTLDAAGNIYATAGTGEKAGIYVFSPEGKPLALVATPGDPTNCELGGGDEQQTLYTTAALSREADTKYGLFRIRLAAP